ncbi:uncharacterized protein BXZ73DRAFT_75725 [Epithele typhae]|uniref:uncharacterized protein n=1 Tax=Epithele typhae TaxID=378194 RepID=UPI0020080F7F|nr:uncharacterized protein BXZ73DRAFT_75725 [Epithele typhae]KAH9940115.1 hypothetical protein BXZ73DRAFT_75725 [Epithele typhae]
MAQFNKTAPHLRLLSRPSAQKEVTALNDALKSAQQELARSQEKAISERDIAQNDAREHARESERLAEEKKQLKHEAEETRSATQAKLETARQNIRGAQGVASRAEARSNELQRELTAVREELRQTAALLETRSVELRAAQVFLTRADDIADSEVVRMVTNLNSCVFQIAAVAADAFQSRCRVGDSKEDEDACAKLVSAGGIGRNVVDALARVDHTIDNTLVQVALQGIMTAYAHQLCSRWGCADEKNLMELYASIKAQEPQSVAGRWRSLFRTHVRQLREREGGESGKAVAGFVEALVTVLRVCGVADDTNVLYLELQRAHADALQTVVSLVFEFRRAAGEAIVSHDFSVVSVGAQETYDEARMEDEWEGPKKRRQKGEVEAARPVCCTTGLGLLREGNGSEGGRVLLVKPKVILSSIVDKL